MSIKYCFNQEIHKSFNLPCDFSTLVKDINSLFVQKLPLNYLLQYEDADGDKIAITNDQEYRILIKQELPTVLSSVKIFVTSLSRRHMFNKRNTSSSKANSEGSFELVGNESSLQLEEIELEDQVGEEYFNPKVISLQIPIHEQSKEEKKVEVEVESKQEESFYSSASGKPRSNESKDRLEEMSLSMVEEQNYGDGVSCVLKTKTEEENFSEFARENYKTSLEVQEDVEKNRKTVSLEILDLKEKKTSNLSKYLSNIAIKVPEKSSNKKESVLCRNTPANYDLQDKHKEDSSDRWISFSSQSEDTKNQGMTFQKSSLYRLNQKSESWFLCNQERSYRYRENEDEKLNCDQQSSSEKSNDSPNSFREFIQEDLELKDTGRYYELETKPISSKKESVEMSFRENADDLLQDIWFDLQGQVKSQIDTGRNNSYPDFDSKKDIPTNEESIQENGETMNISLLTASEAKRIASAIGSISRIKGLKKLELFPESTAQKNASTTKLKVTSPVCSRWACRKSDIKLPGEEDWPFLKQTEAHNSKKEVSNLAEDKVHEGSFCMGCWRSPIKGVRYVCLICDDIEYCENCEVKINHCHPLLKIKEPIGALQDFIEDLRSKFDQKSENDFPKEELGFKEDSIYKDINALGRSLNLANSQIPEEVRDEYKFEYKEISSTPLMIKSNKKEWCVVYKTICLRNTGNAMWRRCHFEPIGIVPGTISEVSYVAPGDSVLITLEIHGFFVAGKYNSQWRVVHQSEIDDLCEMGYINLEFEVVESKGNGFGRQEAYENEELFCGKKLGPLEFY